MLNLKLMQRLDTAELDIATLKNDYDTAKLDIATLQKNYKNLEARVSSNEETINENDYVIRDLDSRVTVDGKDITALDL